MENFRHFYRLNETCIQGFEDFTGRFRNDATSLELYAIPHTICDIAAEYMMLNVLPSDFKINFLANEVMANTMSLKCSSSIMNHPLEIEFFCAGAVSLYYINIDFDLCNLSDESLHQKTPDIIHLPGMKLKAHKHTDTGPSDSHIFYFGYTTFDSMSRNVKEISVYLFTQITELFRNIIENNVQRKDD